jgi:hypothetical protein
METILWRHTEPLCANRNLSTNLFFTHLLNPLSAFPLRSIGNGILTTWRSLRNNIETATRISFGPSVVHTILRSKVSASSLCKGKNFHIFQGNSCDTSNLESSLGIAISQGLDYRGFGVQFLTRQDSFLHSVQTNSEAYPASYSMGNGDPFLEDKAAGMWNWLFTYTSCWC